MVILLHAIWPLKSQTFTDRSGSFVVIAIIDGITRLAVPAFFMISGALVLSNPIKNVKNFYKKSLIKLFIPFVIFALLAYFYYHIRNNSPFTLANFIARLSNYADIQLSMWFMYVILIIYLFIPYLQKIVTYLSRDSLRRLIVTIFITGNLFNTIALVSNGFGRPLLSGVYIGNIVTYTNYLLAGYYLYHYDINRKNQIRLYTAGLVALSLLVITGWFMPDWKTFDGIAQGDAIFAFFIGIAGFTFFKYHVGRITIKKNLGQALAKVSNLVFYIYMLQSIAIDESTRLMFTVYNGNPNIIESLGLRLVATAITFVATLILAYLFSHVYDEAIKLLSKAFTSLTRSAS